MANYNFLDPRFNKNATDELAAQQTAKRDASPAMQTQNAMLTAQLPPNNNPPVQPTTPKKEGGVFAKLGAALLKDISDNVQGIKNWDARQREAFAAEPADNSATTPAPTVAPVTPAPTSASMLRTPTLEIDTAKVDSMRTPLPTAPTSITVDATPTPSTPAAAPVRVTNRDLLLNAAAGQSTPVYNPTSMDAYRSDAKFELRKMFTHDKITPEMITALANNLAQTEGNAQKQVELANNTTKVNADAFNNRASGLLSASQADAVPAVTAAKQTDAEASMITAKANTTKSAADMLRAQQEKEVAAITATGRKNADKNLVDGNVLDKWEKEAKTDLRNDPKALTMTPQQVDEYVKQYKLRKTKERMAIAQ